MTLEGLPLDEQVGTIVSLVEMFALLYLWDLYREEQTARKNLQLVKDYAEQNARFSACLAAKKLWAESNRSDRFKEENLRLRRRLRSKKRRVVR